MTFDKYLETRMNQCLAHFQSAGEKYRAIWDKYEKQMPTCTECCGREKDRRYSWIDGPQGIYWIGKNPRVFFVGQENFGWYGWKSEKEFVRYAPLEFAYFTVESMGGYWGVLKGLMQEVLDIELTKWDEILENVAFSNACKCLTDSGSFKWFLHYQCAKQQYLEHEIIVVNAPVNVLFTKSYEKLSGLKLEAPIEILDQDNDFLCAQSGNQFFIECGHPGRKSFEWRSNLEKRIKKYLSDWHTDHRIGA